MHIIADVKINVRVKIQAGSINGKPNMIWVDGVVKSCDTGGSVWVHVLKADQLYQCKPEEVFANLADVREMIKASAL